MNRKSWGSLIASLLVSAVWTAQAGAANMASGAVVGKYAAASMPVVPAFRMGAPGSGGSLTAGVLQSGLPKASLAAPLQAVPLQSEARELSLAVPRPVSDAEAVVPAAKAQDPVLEALQSASAQEPAQAAPGQKDLAQAWSEGARSFDGLARNEAGVPLVDAASFRFRRLNRNEDGKVRTALQYAAKGSQVSRELNDEFQKRGGYFLMDADNGAGHMASAAMDSSRRPVVVLTSDLLNRYNGRWEDVYRGAPWEFIASVIAREQVFFNPWYDAVPASAEKLAVSFMNMVRVFVDLTNGTSRSWATDKDYQAVKGDQASYVGWNWFEQLVAAARAAAQGVGTNVGHLIESKFLAWARDWAAPQQKADVPGYGYSLWEQYDGRYYRPGDAKDGQPLPPSAPRIDKGAYDGASYTAYGADGKGSAQNGRADENTVFGWIIKWFKGRREI